ncbi:MAG: YraN family protein [Chitinophagaceae bacterium]|nr:MAG: YraN family protein [Chitinophagaceae bacterium]
MARHLKYGKSAEKAAADFLVAAGYHILATNYRTGRAEVDIIASKDKILVFVEVKARSRQLFGLPEEAVGTKKQAMLLQAADIFIEETNWTGDARFDIIAVTGSGAQQEIYHIEDAFH